MSMELENLMRGAIARSGQLLEVILVNVIFNILAVTMGLFGVYLVAVVRTPQAYMFAPYVIAGSMALAAKAGFLLHRKWSEYAKVERVSEQHAGAFVNPSVNARNESRVSVGIANLMAVAAIALPVLIYSYMQIWTQSPSMIGVLQVLPSLGITILSVWAWIDSAR